MSLDEFKKGVMELYQGEVIGEVLTNRMLAFYDDPQQRYKVAVLLQLETETKARLRPVIMRLGLDPTELEESRRAGHEFAESLAGLDWTAAMARLRDGIKPFVERYMEIETMAPAEYRDTAHAMVVHEQAGYRFAALEAAGNTTHSLDDVVAQLTYPLPRPR
jgi:hypothetical protein